MRAVLAALCAGVALTAAPAAGAKEFAAIAVVAADGGSTHVHAPATVIDELFDGRVHVAHRGGYVRVYPLGPTGYVGIPGRFYPATGAVCLAWNQAAEPRGCWAPGPALLPRLRRASGGRLFHGTGPSLSALASTRVRTPVLGNLRAAFELAFDRSRLARPAVRPARCLPFSGAWRGTGSTVRPGRFCLSERGVYAAGMLYPLGVAPFRLAFENQRR